MANHWIHLWKMMDFYDREKNGKQMGTFIINVTCCLPVTRYRNDAIKLAPT